MFLLSFFTEPIKSIIDLEPSLRYAKTSYDRINELLRVKQIDLKKDQTIISGDIEIKNLSYSYNNVDYIFKNKSFKIEQNQKYLIYGTSGSGKSSFIKILLKYIDNYDGQILIDNKNLKDYSSGSINNSFLYISQNEELFSQTIKQNIILDREISDKKYINVLKMCKVDEIIEQKKLRDNFYIEEKGFNISGGEKQRIILARALLKNFNYLIMDEALSEVSYKMEKEIIQNIISNFKDKTIIYISHNELNKDLFENQINWKGGENFG